MRKTLSLIFAFFCIAMSAQKTMTLEQVNAQWAAKTLKVAQGKSVNIIAFVDAFQRELPTYCGRELLKFAKNSAGYDNTDKVVDVKNGFARYSEDDPEAETDEVLEACLWRRTNGHMLFAVSLHRLVEENAIDVLCFYDYNPGTKTLTPEKKLTEIVNPSFPGYNYRVLLPQTGKELRVVEYFGILTIQHRYQWDGMKPANPQIEIERMGNYQATFAENVFFADEHPLTQYALYDIDNDGFPELWLASADKSYQAVFAVKLTMEFLAGQSDRRTMSLYKGAVATSGDCGALCQSFAYQFVKQSSRDKSLVCEQTYDEQSDDYGNDTFTLNGNEISEAEGQRMINALGREIKPVVKWRKIE